MFSLAAIALNPRFVAALILVALTGLLLYNMHDSGFESGLAKGRKELAALQSTQAAAFAKSFNIERERNIREVAQLQLALRAHNDLQGQLSRDNARLKRSITHATTQYRPAPDQGLRPVPRCVFTTGAVGLLNTAAGAGDPGVSADAAASSAQPDPAADGALDSGVSTEDLLAWGIDLGTRCRDIESRLRKVIELWPAP